MRNIRYRAAAMLLIIFVLCLFGCERRASSGQWNQQGYKDTAFSDAGFYYTDNGYLCFLDTKTGVNVYLCSRPGCTHGGTKGDEKVCDAHLSVSSVYSTMGFWDGHLYYIEDQAQYGSVVMRRNADGTAETKVAELCQQYLNKDSTAEVTEMIIADGYLYYAVTVRAIIETEPNVHVEKPVLYAVSCVDLRTGNDTELYADQTFTTLIAAKDSTVLFEPVEVDSKYAKQSGGRGQYGHCKVKFAPMDPNGEEVFKFESTVVGGAIPKEYIPAVGEGIEEATKAGILAGFPVLGVYANVYDGSYHEVDSSEMAFHIAGSLAFKEAMQKAKPVLLEPIMKVEITMPEEYMGDVIGDVNSRRGRIEGMDDIGGGKKVRAFVPLAEMFGYSTDLRSKTQGRGNYSMFFDKYEAVPKNVQEKVIASRAK